MEFLVIIIAAAIALAVNSSRKEDLR